MDKIELRIANLDFTSTNEHELTVEGVVNDGDWSQTLGSRRKFKERIEKGAFKRAITRALANNGKIDFLVEHDPERVLASTVNDSLTLWEDENKGLCIRAIICPTSWGKDTFQLIKSGIIKSMSFGFNVIEDSWSNTRSEVASRVVKDLNLIEVSAVRNPAYLSSMIAARGMDLVEDIPIPEENQEQEIEKVLEAQQEQEAQVEQETPNGSQVIVDTTNIEEIMNKVFQQFETILSNYIPKQQEKPVEQEQSESQTVNVNSPQDTDNVENVDNVKEGQAVEEDVIKSDVDYAIELLSKYKKIQELQK